MSDQGLPPDRAEDATPPPSSPTISRRQLLRRGGALGVGGALVGLGGCVALRTWRQRSYRRGLSLAGAEFGPDHLPGVHGVDYFYPTSGSLDYYLARGLTLLRIPCRWERLQRELEGDLDPEETGRLDAVIAAASERKMQVIIDIHNFARYRGQLIGTVAVPETAFADFWRRLAEHYRTEAAIWAYGLMNEPHDTGGRWPTAAQAGVNGIRAADQQHTILVAGDGWSSAANWRHNNEALRITDRSDKIIYEAHQYFDADNTGRYAASYEGEQAYPTIGVDRVRQFSSWLADHNLRGFLGEYGVPDNDPRWLDVLDRFLTFLDDQGIGGTYWAGGEHWGDYRLGVTPNARGDRPQMAVLQRHLSR